MSQTGGVQTSTEHVEPLPREQRARLTFKTGAHIVEKTVADIEGQTAWQCCARNGGPTCPKEGPTTAMKVAVTNDGTVVIVCPLHGVALHKAGQSAGKRIDTRRTLQEYLDSGVLDDMRQRDATAERHWQAAQEVASLVDEF